MGKFWTRRNDNLNKDERTADPWRTAKDGLHAADLAPKAKPQDAKVNLTERPKD